MMEILKGGAHVILRRKQLEARTGLSRSSIYGRLSPKSPQYDPSFPKPIRLGAGFSRGGSVGWIEAEVNDWIVARAESRSVAQ